uniref:Uncharacterized protein n=1 Tax=mine drainage metagenome TaxID=410659 RepID=E6Q0A0_9ZZZZ
MVSPARWSFAPCSGHSVFRVCGRRNRTGFGSQPDCISRRDSRRKSEYMEKVVFACFAQPLVQNGGSSLLILLELCDKGERKEYERAIFFLKSGFQVRDFGLGGGEMVTSPLGVLWQIGW